MLVLVLVLPDMIGRGFLEVGSVRAGAARIDRVRCRQSWYRFA